MEKKLREIKVDESKIALDARRYRTIEALLIRGTFPGAFCLDIQVSIDFVRELADGLEKLLPKPEAQPSNESEAKEAAE